MKVTLEGRAVIPMSRFEVSLDTTRLLLLSPFRDGFQLIGARAFVYLLDEATEGDGWKEGEMKVWIDGWVGRLDGWVGG